MSKANGILGGDGCGAAGAGEGGCGGGDWYVKYTRAISLLALRLIYP